MLIGTYTITRSEWIPTNFDVECGDRRYICIFRDGFYRISCFENGVLQYEQTHGQTERLALEFIEGDMANAIRQTVKVEMAAEVK